MLDPEIQVYVWSASDFWLGWKPWIPWKLLDIELVPWNVQAHRVGVPICRLMLGIFPYWTVSVDILATYATVRRQLGASAMP